MNAKYPPLSAIKVGEPDANSEYFAALRTKSSPVFLDCFSEVPTFPLDVYLSGEKFIIYGQKGTGKTSILRYLQKRLSTQSVSSTIRTFPASFG